VFIEQGVEVSKVPATDEAAARYTHVVAHRDSYLTNGTLKTALANIAGNTGSFSGSLRTIRGFLEASAIADWFQTGDVGVLKNAFYARSKIDYILTSSPYREVVNDHAFEGIALCGMFPLVSDNRQLIDWYAKIDGQFNDARINNLKQFDFWTKQFFLALRGEWDVLGDRCQRIIDSPPQGSRERKFMIDHHFYLALAKGDLVGMREIIEQLVSQKSISRRASLEGGYTQGLLCTPAILYSKLAWRHGYEIEIDSPYVPRDWLPINPIFAYTDPFEFMHSYPLS
jgi:hypothetical protein